jgi:N-acetylmuramoyl-L-alanine amidase
MKLVAVLAVMQFAAADPQVLTVRTTSGEAFVPIVNASAGPAVQAKLLSPIVPTQISDVGAGRYKVSVGGVDLTVLLESPYVEHAGKIYPLISSPFVDGGELYLPLQLYTEHLVRLEPSRFKYTTATRELRFTPPAKPAQPVVASSASPSRPEARSQTLGTSPSTRLTAKRKRRVVVDAGHGGRDPGGGTGPIGARNKVAEKDITLAVARKLRDALQEYGVDVVMTRDKDTLIALHDRGRIANEAGGDLFISIHVNSPNMKWRNPSSVRGFETYFLAEAKTEDEQRVADMENSAVRFETEVQAESGDPLSFIIADMAQNEHLRESLQVASLIQDRLASFHPGTNRGVKQANFAVLRGSYMPAVLVEIGFGSNPEESRFLTNPSRQTQIAHAIADAAVEYLADYERRIGAAAP